MVLPLERINLRQKYKHTHTFGQNWSLHLDFKSPNSSERVGIDLEDQSFLSVKLSERRLGRFIEPNFPSSWTFEPSPFVSTNNSVNHWNYHFLCKIYISAALAVFIQCSSSAQSSPPCCGTALLLGFWVCLSGVSGPWRDNWPRQCISLLLTYVICMCSNQQLHWKGRSCCQTGDGIIGQAGEGRTNRGDEEEPSN